MYGSPMGVQFKDSTSSRSPYRSTNWEGETLLAIAQVSELDEYEPKIWLGWVLMRHLGCSFDLYCFTYLIVLSMFDFLDALCRPSKCITFFLGG